MPALHTHSTWQMRMLRALGMQSACPLHVARNSLCNVDADRLITHSSPPARHTACSARGGGAKRKEGSGKRQEHGRLPLAAADPRHQLLASLALWPLLWEPYGAVRLRCTRRKREEGRGEGAAAAATTPYQSLARMALCSAMKAGTLP